MSSTQSYVLPQGKAAKGIHLKAEKDAFWGRRRSIAPISGALSAIALLIATPSVVIASWVTIEHFDGSVFGMLSMLCRSGIVAFVRRYFPSPTIDTLVVYLGWIAAQAFLHTSLPGKYYTGQATPGGNVLVYKINGLITSIAMVIVFVMSGVAGIVDLACIAKAWPGFLLAAVIYGYLVSMAMHLKACFAPSYRQDTRFSGSAIHDFFSGCELNPRWGPDWDIKLFHIGRPGMAGWLMMYNSLAHLGNAIPKLTISGSDISFAALHTQLHGSISNSMIVVLLLHGVYIVDFFWNESWYLRTIDIHHDHFGFYLAWGSAVWLPVMYSLNAQFLAYHSIHLSLVNGILILALGIIGYAIFRSANNQKLRVRLTDGNCMTFGRVAEVIPSSYKTSDGVTHKSLLLSSGWWGYARHANYTGDILMAFAFCAPCGTTYLLPWTYFIYLSLLLINRCFRDEARCRAKYGEDWKKYCQRVKWRFCPGVF